MGAHRGQDGDGYQYRDNMQVSRREGWSGRGMMCTRFCSASMKPLILTKGCNLQTTARALCDLYRLAELDQIVHHFTLAQRKMYNSRL